MQLPTNALKRMSKNTCIDAEAKRDDAIKTLKLRGLIYRYPLLSPSTKHIKNILARNEKLEKELAGATGCKRKRELSPEGKIDLNEISEETKVEVIRNNKLIAHRGISPCTEEEMSLFKTNDKCMKQSKVKQKVKHRPGNGKLTLLDIHHEFEQVHCLTTMLVEPIVLTRKGKKPNVVMDAIVAVCVVVDDERAKIDLKEDYRMVKLIIAVKDQFDVKLGNNGILIGMQDKVELRFADCEFDLIQQLIDTIHYYNPDIIMGYDMLHMSIGFINSRCTKVYELDLLSMISRVPKTWQKLNKRHYIMKERNNKFTEEMGLIQKEKYYYFDLKVTGRVLYNVHDSMVLSLHLKDYELDRVAFDLLQK